MYFGDGVVGKALSSGNIVVLTYVVTNGAAANTASVFSNAAAIDTVVSVSVETVSEASGGAAAETIASIKFNAPLDYASQGRCVTAEDYKTFVRQYYPNTHLFLSSVGRTVLLMIQRYKQHTRIWKSFYIC